MKTLTRKQERLAKLMHLGGSQILGLTTGKLTVFYKLEALANEFGRAAFRLSKADAGDGPREVYDVLLDGQRSTCECLGFLRWGHCKHVESLTALAKSGRLPKPASEDDELMELTAEPLPIPDDAPFRTEEKCIPFVLRALHRHGGRMSLGEIMGALPQLDKSLVKSVVRNMASRGIIRDEGGLYSAKEEKSS